MIEKHLVSILFLCYLHFPIFHWVPSTVLLRRSVAVTANCWHSVAVTSRRKITAVGVSCLFSRGSTWDFIGVFVSCPGGSFRGPCRGDGRCLPPCDSKRLQFRSARPCLGAVVLPQPVADSHIESGDGLQFRTGATAKGSSGLVHFFLTNQLGLINN